MDAHGETRVCMEPQHSVRFPEVPTVQHKKAFYGDQDRCMACSDYARLVAMTQERRQPQGTVHKFTTPPTFSLEQIRDPAPVYANLKRCMHPLHEEWFWLSKPNPLQLDQFEAPTDGACRACARLNAVMNKRHETRLAAQKDFRDTKVNGKEGFVS
jgi:hypothetical protein